MVNCDIAALVVDDHELMRDAVGEMLRALGITRVDLAPDGVAALKMLEQVDYAVVLADFRMEPMTGLELLQRVRSRMHPNKPQFILTTSSSSNDLALRAKREGADAVLLKPFAVKELRKKLADLLS